VILAVLSNITWLRWTVILMILLSPVILPQAVKERIAWTWEDAHNPGREFGVDFSFQERIIAFDRSFSAVKRNPVFGLGISSWNYVDNQYARTLHEVGLLGLGLWLWIFLRLFKIGRWLYRYLPDGSLKGMALGYSAGIIAILMHGLGSCTFYIIRIMEPFWFISGLVIALYLIKVRECTAPQESSLV
jgi:O-antigen ligase